MTDKPEVEGWRVTRLSGKGYGRHSTIVDADIYNAQEPSFWVSGAMERHSIEPLIRLTDLEASRAADKARIAELEAALSIDLPKLLDRLDEALEDIELHGRHSDRGYHQLSGWYKNARRITSAIDAALAQHGKENTDGQ